MNTVDNAVNDSTKEAIEFEQGNEHEIRFYLKQIREAIVTGQFVPSYLVTAVILPTSAIELTVNNSSIPEKIDYILEAYDHAMRLKTNENIVMQNIMIV